MMMKNAFQRTNGDVTQVKKGNNLLDLDGTVRTIEVSDFEGNDSSLSFGLGDYDSGAFSVQSDISGPSRRSNRSSTIRSDSLSEFSSAISIGGNDLKKNKTVQELTVNKIKYDAVGMVGREDEVECLQSLLSNLQTGKKELVFIKGFSGVGKSILARSVKNTMNRTMKNGCFVEGKFDLNRREEPYSAITEALGQICQRIMEHHELKIETSQAISKELGSEIGPLLKLMPILGDLISQHNNFDSDGIKSTGSSFNSDAGQAQFKHFFRVLTRQFSSCFSPLVISLDDLQWADVTSLEVIDYIMTDTENLNPLMIIGSFRSNEVDETHVLTTKSKELEDKKEKSGFNTTEIEVGNLDLKGVNTIIMALLGIDNEGSTEDLAEVCHRRTLGNPFFLVRFITMLEQEDLITFNLGLFKWMWDAEEIDQKTMSAGNVRELLKRRMTELDEETQLLLQYAACLGSSFSLSKLLLVWEKHLLDGSSEVVDVSDNVEEMFTVLVEERFIESSGKETFRWVHDKVQEAALELCDASRKDAFQNEIGSILYHNLDEDEKEEMLFDIADLVNKGGPKRKYVELNLRAAEKARAISAFQSVATYVSNGIGGLPMSEKWTTHKDLALRLHTLGAQMGYSLRDNKMIESFSSEVLCQEGCSALEKVQIYCAKINQLMIEDPTFKSAIDLSLVALKELGAPIKGNKVTLAVKAGVLMLKSLKKAKKISKEGYRSLEIMSDPEAVAMMHLLCNLEVILYLTGDVSLLLISSTRRIDLTLKYGIHDSSAFAFAFLGMCACSMGKHEDGTYLGEQALYMQSKATSNYYKSQASFSLYYSIFPWSQPLHSCLPPLLEGYNSGLRTGNVEIGGACLYFHHIEIPLCLGKSLAQIEDNVRIVMSQLSTKSFIDSTKMIWQLILNLRGRAPDVTVLKGEHFNIEEFTMKTPVQSASAWGNRLWIMTIYGQYQKAADEAISNGNGYYQKNFGAVATVMTEMFLRGVVLYAAARQTKKGKYKRCAKKVRKTFLNWQKKGNPNVQHYECLLSAEDAALSKNYSHAEKLYVQTITLAARSGSMYVAALANERYADLLKTQLSDDEEAKYRTKEAIRFFKDWGAEAKVQMLEESLE